MADGRMSNRHTAAKIAALESWAQCADRNARTQPARDGLIRRFEREVAESDPEGRMSPGDRAKAVEAKRRAYYTRIAKTRWKKKAT
jgi:hypothetical protein